MLNLLLQPYNQFAQKVHEVLSPTPPKTARINGPKILTLEITMLESGLEKMYFEIPRAPS
jgi:hypothetical protein